MTKRKLNGIWNAPRVLNEYLSLANREGSIREIDASDNSPYAIRVQRLAAVLKAYEKEANLPSFVSKGFISQTCSEEKVKEFCQLLRKGLHNDELYMHYANNSKWFDVNRDRDYLFSELFRYRKTLYELESAWSGMLECPFTVSFAIKATKNLYQEHIKVVSDTLDKMLILLMGDDYEKSFTEEELIPFGYPDITDEKLEEMLLDF